MTWGNFGSIVCNGELLIFESKIVDRIEIVF